MNKPKFTPAPWFYETGAFVWDNTGNLIIADVHTGKSIAKEWQANAYLIKASPLLFHAAQMAEYCLSEGEIVTPEDVKRALKALREAIAEALDE